MAFIPRAACFCLLIAIVHGLTIDVAEGVVEEVTDRNGLRVVGGRSSRPHAHPYQVSLQRRFLWARLHVCGGCVITEKWVLTAGHCLTSSWVTWLMPLDVVAGAHDINAKEGTVQVSRAAYKLVHPQYNNDVGPFDIGLVRVKNPFRWTRWVRPARLPTRNDVMPARATLTGWGSTSTGYWPDFPSLLQVIDLPIMKYQECYRVVENISDSGDPNPLDEDSNICTEGGLRAAGGAACIGDSGGPLVMAAPGAPVTALHSLPLGSTPQTSAEHDQGSTPQKSTTQPQESDEDVGTGPTVPVSCGREAPSEPPYVPPVVIGVVSWGLLPCGSDDAPSVYTKVSNFLDYIESHVEL